MDVGICNRMIVNFVIQDGIYY